MYLCLCCHVKRIPYNLCDGTREEVVKLIKSNFAEPLVSAYHFQLATILKRDCSILLCFDYKDLNAKTKPSKYHTSWFNKILKKLKNTLIFTAIGLKTGHCHRFIREDQGKTILLSWSNVRFKWMSQGLFGACCRFSESSERLSFDMYEYCVSYFDDFIIFYYIRQIT